MRWWSLLELDDNTKRAIQERIDAIDAQMKKILLEENPFLLPEKWYRDDPIVQSIWPGGKRLRPLLCLLSCEATCGNWKRALPSSAGIEFLHTFTLVHDDVMDRSLLRRGRPTVYSEWGESVAIAAGDALYNLAIKSILRNLDVEGVTMEQIKKILDLTTRKCFSLARGQTIDILSEKTMDVTIDDYIKMVELKTSPLMELSLMAGAIIGGADDQEVHLFEELGRELGKAFQIQDDVLDVEGIRTGKPVGLDLQRRKKTIIVIHAMENLNDTDGKRLKEFLKGGMVNFGELMDIFRKTGSIDFAKRKAREYLVNVKTKIQMLEDNPGKRYLEKLVDYVANRVR